MEINDRPIGFFDSGVGGISVLREAVKVLKSEDFIYFGDSKNAPYGTKSYEEIQNLTLKAAQFLVGKNVKAIVVACNTATSVAIKELRQKYKGIPIIGIEPAIKPAVEQNKGGKIVIMATPMTLAEQKFNRLMNKYIDKAEFVPIACPQLVQFVESGKLSGKEVDDYLKEKLSEANGKIGAVVLGCTHYPFVREAVQNIARDAFVIDGSLGTVNQLKRQLGLKNMLKDNNKDGEIVIYNSLKTKEKLSYKLLNL